jgi:hypothetical protein
VRHPSIGTFDDNSPIDILEIIKPTDKHIIMCRHIMDVKGFFLEHKIPQSFLVLYETETQQIFIPDFPFYCRMGSPSNLNADYHKNQYAFFMGADELKEELESGELDGKIKEIAEQLHEEDNPVLQVITLKE